jgi:putative intracellular protease/amidase
MFWFKAIAASILIVLALAGCAGQTSPTTSQESEFAADEATTAIDPYQPRFGRSRPVVAVVAPADGAELTDFVVPYGVLAASESADVISLGTTPGPIEMMPALIIEPDATTGEFDEGFPEGADYVIVPAVHYPDDPALVAWLQEQERKGATLVGICDGVLVLAEAGVLEGRSATGHWFSMSRLRKHHPNTRWLRNQRYVADGNIVTTTGVSASIPVSIALVEAIAGSQRAEDLAASLGIDDWSTTHESDAFGVRARHLLTLVRNGAAFWKREEIGIDVQPGVDEITLALKADLWSRTYRSRAYSVAGSREVIPTRGGLKLVPDRVASSEDAPDRWVASLNPSQAGTAIDFALDRIAAAYGPSTAAFVALQIEHAWHYAE